MNNTKSKTYGINKSLLSKDSFWMVKKNIAMETGLRIEGSAFLAELIEYHNWLMAKGFIKFGQEFFYKQIHTKEDKEREVLSGEKIRSIESNTRIPKHSQDKYIQILKELNFLEVVRKGIPPRLYYKILFENIIKFESKTGWDEFSSDQETKFYDTQSYENL